MRLAPICGTLSLSKRKTFLKTSKLRMREFDATAREATLLRKLRATPQTTPQGGHLAVTTRNSAPAKKKKKIKGPHQR